MKCRHCHSSLDHVFLDLGFAPPSNAYLTVDELKTAEKIYPLKVRVCSSCWLVQTEDYTDTDELFNRNYAYFSSTSTTWLIHAEKYVEKIIAQLSLSKKSMVVEIASNDGYLLKNFVAKDIPCLGVEPTDSTAAAAEKLGIPVLREFFGEKLGKELCAKGFSSDLIIGNNVYAHVPDINDFTLGLKALLNINGTITLEFPHLLSLLQYSQFDTIYHEHFSYLSLYTVKHIFEKAGLRIYGVEEIPTHGGSLRIFGCHKDNNRKASSAVESILGKERKAGLHDISTYLNFQYKVEKIKKDLISFLVEQKNNGKKVVAYGAAAKGNTLLNYAGIKEDVLPFICDASVSKQDKFMPGSHIPIVHPKLINNYRPDYVIILPWNIKDEIMEQLKYIHQWCGKFVTVIPNLEII